MLLTFSKNRFLAFILAICCSYSYSATQEQEVIAPDVRALIHTNITSKLKPHLVFKTKEQGEAWLNSMSYRLRHFVADPFFRRQYLIIIQYEAARAGLDPQLILSLITVESRFNKYAISVTGARGLMQVMPFWINLVGDPRQNLFDAETNVRYGCVILRYYLQKEHGDLDRALQRYNGNMMDTGYPNLVYRAYDQYWRTAPVLSLESGRIKYVDYTKYNPIFNLDQLAQFKE